MKLHLSHLSHGHHGRPRPGPRERGAKESHGTVSWAVISCDKVSAKHLSQRASFVWQTTEMGLVRAGKGRQEWSRYRWRCRGKKFRLFKCCECWESLGLEEDSRPLTNGAWMNKKRGCDPSPRLLARGQLPLLSASPLHKALVH